MSREIDRQDFSINRVTPARRKGFAVTTALLALTASIVMATGTTAHATATAALSKGAFQAQALYRIWNWNSPDKCLVTQGNANGKPVFQWGGCVPNHFPDQDWFFRFKGHDQNGEAYFQIVNNNGNFNNCLLTRNFGAAAGLAVQWDCLDFQDQFWYVEWNSDITFYLRNVASPGSCLVVRANESQASLTPCAGFQDQWWFLTSG
jgi:hypothetical protein